MELEQIFALLGVSNFAEAATAITRFNAFLGDVRAQTGRQNTQEAFDAVRASVQLSRNIEQAVGAQGGECMARIAALQASAERLQNVEQQLQTMQRAQAEQEAGTLIEQATREGRLPPAQQERARALYAEYGAKALKSFLDMLPPATTALPQAQLGGARQAPAQRDGAVEGSTDLTPEERQVIKAMGKTPEQYLEARTLWTKTSGKLSDGELTAMNDALARGRGAQGLGAR